MKKNIQFVLGLSLLMSIGSLCAMETAEGEIQAGILKLYNDQKNAAIKQRAKELREREIVENALQQLRRLRAEQKAIMHDELSSQPEQSSNNITSNYANLMIERMRLERLRDAEKCSRTSKRLIHEINSLQPHMQYIYVSDKFPPYKSVNCSSLCYSETLMLIYMRPGGPGLPH